ncbi:sugar phosphate nucleotidyltransferase [Candidatus Enterococcus ferrettii]|uniref:Nucleotidyl transferase domain-containing protein n=1 Tax=Candidatus Enterococcus ferrettii TaxID=2815324 RepID=A0ABV0ELC1_9ENTE|nr:phosphocholine cytidylyltransferase family protein [Enterococcus sp. 665A]MBO1341788.1 phosphocholine cytidylyltransferase family protein [Enterococcus sp. 665A]
MIKSALILAGGLGSRLRPKTNDIPKALVEVNGTPIIVNQIKALQSKGISKIIIISGYLNEVLEGELEKLFEGVKFIHNKRFDETNNMYSAFLSKKELYGESFLLMNSDVFFDEVIIEDLLESVFSNGIAVEKGNYDNESMKIIVDENKVNSISKSIKEDKAYGTSIDVYKFSSEGSKEFFDASEEIIINQKDENSWTEVALDSIFDKVDFFPIDISGRWMEIDNLDDLKKAEGIFYE